MITMQLEEAAYLGGAGGRQVRVCDVLLTPFLGFVTVIAPAIIRVLRRKVAPVYLVQIEEPAINLGVGHRLCEQRAVHVS
jgi:hypothetical protein